VHHKNGSDSAGAIFFFLGSFSIPRTNAVSLLGPIFDFLNAFVGCFSSLRQNDETTPEMNGGQGMTFN
jgi:hypothetical protein